VLAPIVRDANGETTAVDLSGIDGDALIVLSAAASAEGTSINVKLQHGNLANGTDAVDVPGGAFTTLANAASLQKISIPRDELGKYVRLSFTGEVSTYSAAVSVVALGSARYMS
jgi:hypothetical protein